MNVFYIPKSYARKLCPKRTHPPKTVGNPVQRELVEKRRRAKLHSQHMSEAIKRKWQNPEYRKKNLPNALKNLIQYREVNTEEERQEQYEEQIQVIEKMAASRNTMSSTYVMRFMDTYCPEVEIEPNMPLGYYEEMLEFFHPELVWQLEKEWKKDFEGYIKE